MTTDLSPDVYLSRPPRPPVVRVVLILCLTVAFLGACAVEVARAARDAYAAKACADSGGTWNFGACSVPAINIEIVPRGPTHARDPLAGPGGA